ncbi:hypothetical protein BCR34DRAFT_584372 [Clohesyomyces aquaticus]|uniref:Uncharacterized protein n=1 Tax=Clohesyomyces aquaticus TaxID=1231657 RepID=A0A1Y2A1Q0_9PLEO|nr:hypothetical protein BCR34DRAFT_584372 [Clohesyomyces aquaticus]
MCAPYNVQIQPLGRSTSGSTSTSIASSSTSMAIPTTASHPQQSSASPTSLTSTTLESSADRASQTLAPTGSPSPKESRRPSTALCPRAAAGVAVGLRWEWSSLRLWDVPSQPVSVCSPHSHEVSASPMPAPIPRPYQYTRPPSPMTGGGQYPRPAGTREELVDLYEQKHCAKQRAGESSEQQHDLSAS